MATGHDAEAGPEISASVAIVAAEYEAVLYAGAYQGITPSLGWSCGRLGASATISLYHLEENGRGLYGFGDAMLGGHAVVFASERLRAGAALHVMLPTGAALDDLGMGHVMAMPSVWAGWRAAPVTLSASAGYGRALTAMTRGAGHDHGTGPLVAPMNLQELSWSASADLDVGHRVRLGGRSSGAAAIGAGRTRVVGGGRVAWSTPRVSVGFELQLGLVGDPFTMRGVVDTALRF
jgi:hypothetical protein